MGEVTWLGRGKGEGGNRMGLVRGDWKHGLNKESSGICYRIG